MQYKHAFHAGNFADVHKHIALLQLIQALQKKAKGFLYLDTHAGAGLYDLASPEARQGNEGDAGITLLAATHLRAVDQAICVESHAQSSRALQRTLEHSANLIASMPRVVLGDGYHEIRAQLPPALRRGLTLIDPPYEAADEEQQIATALQQGLTRFETGVFAVWYPIKKQYDTDLWLARVLRGISRPAVAIELCVQQPDHTAGLNGSGLMVVNPPWQFDSEAAAWQPELHTLLGGASGSLVKWLIHE